MKQFILFVCFLMFAFMFAPAEDYAKMLEQNDYSVSTITNEEWLEILKSNYDAEYDIEFIVQGSKYGSFIEYVKFEKVSDAKNHINRMKKVEGIKVYRLGSLVKVEKT